MKLDVLDNKGKSVEKIEVSDLVFGAEPNTTVMAQYLRVFNANQRQGTSSSKDRSQVRGGGRKPWAQKGTGRARAGSIRSPIWVGGGVAHGPKPKSWNLSLPKKLRKTAIVSALSLKASKGQVMVLNDLSMKAPKTKEIAELLKTLKLRGKTLLVLDKSDVNILKSASNIEKLNVSLSENLNGFDLVATQDVLFLKNAVVAVSEKYSATK
ncbi:50S ribosomal protein L4 [candidate division WWE3 bacterium]|jgi:large subunit ribosomal protein L4|nr:50S ribosomal protein L4 [candidate division WWE3 bacterium]MBT7349542.1 50S ribosomal protein L4 [candidate division WWE3 bacterium]